MDGGGNGPDDLVLQELENTVFNVIVRLDVWLNPPVVIFDPS